MIFSSFFAVQPCSTWQLVTGDFTLQLSPNHHELEFLLDNAFTQEELCAVDEDPGDVADNEDHYDADENQGEIHLVVDAGVCPVGSSMCVSLNKKDF